MLSSHRPDVKFMGGEWERKRAEALRDRTKFTASELADLDITLASQGYDDNREKAMHCDITPVDPNTRRVRRGFDIRDKPEIGH